jgi:hypothetical protein
VPRQNISQHVMHLVRHGYLDESGLWRRIVKVSPAGQETLRKLSPLVQTLSSTAAR